MIFEIFSHFSFYYQTNQARQQFLFSGPGGLSVDKGRELSEESLNSNILADEGQAERHFIVEKSLR